MFISLLYVSNAVECHFIYLYIYISKDLGNLFFLWRFHMYTGGMRLGYHVGHLWTLALYSLNVTMGVGPLMNNVTANNS